MLPSTTVNPSRNWRKALSYHVTMSSNLIYIWSHIDRVQVTKLKERKSILIITLLNPFQANILFLHHLTTWEHHRYSRLFSGVKWVKQNLYEQLNCERSFIRKWFFKLSFEDSSCKNLKKLRRSMSKKNYFNSKFYKYNPFYTNKCTGEL